MYYLGNYLSDFMGKIVYILYIIHVILYFIVTFKNPGIPSLSTDALKENIENGQKYDICPKCSLITFDRSSTIHCSFCNVCIENLDHHCSWNSKCIGKSTIKEFWAFIVVTKVLLFYLIICTFITAYYL